MTVQIVFPGTTIPNPISYPLLVLGWSYTLGTGRSALQPVNAVSPVVTDSGAGATLRAGTLKLLFKDHQSADECARLLQSHPVAALSDPDVPWESLTFAPIGDIDIALDEQTLRRWTVSVAYAEVDG